MRERRQGSSGLLVFGLFAFVLLGAISATVLVANDYRNLNLLLVRFGYDPIDTSRHERDLQSYEMKGKRMPRPTGLIPERMLVPETPSEARFVRTIRKAPEALCEALRAGGFENSGWKAGAFDASNWECQSTRDFPNDGDGEGGPSSAFLLVRGNAETHVSSFRIKLNIENPATQNAVIDAAVRTIEIFLEEVRWQSAPDILADIRELKEFDIVRLGNRLQFKKEAFGETPRYNFTITPDRTRKPDSYLPDYFDRAQWLPLPKNLDGTH